MANNTDRLLLLLFLLYFVANNTDRLLLLLFLLYFVAKNKTRGVSAAGFVFSVTRLPYGVTGLTTSVALKNLSPVVFVCHDIGLVIAAAPSITI